MGSKAHCSGTWDGLSADGTNAFPSKRKGLLRAEMTLSAALSPGEESSKVAKGARDDARPRRRLWRIECGFHQLVIGGENPNSVGGGRQAHRSSAWSCAFVDSTVENARFMHGVMATRCQQYL